MAKLVYFSREPDESSIGGRLNFVKFETDQIDKCISFMRKLQADQEQLNGSVEDELCIMATGGGAFKYYDKIREALGVKVIREDEMECLIIGTLVPPMLAMASLLTHCVAQQAWTFSSRKYLMRSLPIARKIPWTSYPCPPNPLLYTHTSS